MSAGASSLAELQRLLFDLIRAPEGVAAALRDRGSSAAELERQVRGDARLSAVGRLDIYANMYFFRILDVLRQEYAKLLRVIGEVPFHNLVTRYLQACPSEHFSLREVGARLPLYLVEHLAEHPAEHAAPWLADLARLERARLEVWDRADAAPRTLASLEALGAERFAELRLPLVPALELVPMRADVGSLWAALEAERDWSDPPAREGTLLVWRAGLEVYHRPLDPEEAALLRRAQAGAPFGALCEDLASGRSMQDAALQAYQLLARWVADGVLAEV